MSSLQSASTHDSPPNLRRLRDSLGQAHGVREPFQRLDFDAASIRYRAPRAGGARPPSPCSQADRGNRRPLHEVHAACRGIYEAFRYVFVADVGPSPKARGFQNWLVSHARCIWERGVYWNARIENANNPFTLLFSSGLRRSQGLDDVVSVLTSVLSYHSVILVHASVPSRMRQRAASYADYGHKP